MLPAYDADPFLRQTLDRALAWREVRPAEIVVVDDGSTDDTASILEEYAGRAGLHILSWRDNRGKGHAVRKGMLAATGDLRVFLDAGLTYPLANVDRVLAALAEGADVAIGGRVHPGRRYVVAPTSFRRLYSRHLMGRTFSAIVRALAVPGIRDTQAGIKGMTAMAAREVFGRARLDRFAFDVEILALARRLGFRIEEVPVLFVYEEESSTLRLVRDGRRMLSDVFEVRRRMKGSLGESTGSSRSATSA